ncbi:hypothetical protein CNR34_00113 [Pseudomonas phage nickie]|uniref:Uncharacterized protein n=1 Tax=Pseudomonas phage nickie TaxID=2048977 RepID=A0A2H4P798_9CAUD|nr:hypothetical protein FDJ16_gp052 [Pseudomonas phage nickie]ATW58046.1 hypothetical protein CNR34_00113 [Pseudomonas phage nickie]
MAPLKFEERLKQVCIAEMMQLLVVRADQLRRADEIRQREEDELEEAIQTEWQIETQKLMGGWA